MFIELQNQTYGEFFYASIDCISYFCPASNTLFISTVHGEGTGIIYITNDSKEKLLKILKCKENNLVYEEE